MKKQVFQKLRNKGIVVFANKLIRLIFLKQSYEYQLTKSVNKEKIKFLFSLIHPVDTGRDLIRIGATNDGGYLVPDDLEGIKFCFSPGVGKSYAFEQDLLTRGIKSFLSDPTVDLNENLETGINFEKTAITAATGDFFSSKMFESTNETEFEFKGKSLLDWVNSKISPHENDLLLQLDIENDEYKVLMATPIDFLKRFRILVIEFHSIPMIRNEFILDTIFLPIFKKITREFDVLHVHPNNVSINIPFLDLALPHALEITFLNKGRRLTPPILRSKFEHPLDAQTLANSEPVGLDVNLFN